MSAKQLWRWQGISNEGNPLEGVLWADTRPSLMLALEQRHITPLRINRMRVKASHWSREKSAETIHQLATLLKAGLTLSASLTLLAEQHPSSQWQALLRTLANDMEQGISLSTSLSQWQQVFPPLYQAMIRTGELTGKLDDCCFELARQQKNQQQLADKVKKALRYPIIIITMAVMVVFAMLQFVLPEFAAIYRTFNTPLPALTQWIIAIAHFSSPMGMAGRSIQSGRGCGISPDKAEDVLADPAPRNCCSTSRS
ncbi:type IV pilin biogenesis protein [Citrobacter freundii]|nr:type IV pilin biogenesis protein [Citrobacter freundii]